MLRSQAACRAACRLTLADAASTICLPATTAGHGDPEQRIAVADFM